MKKFIKKVTAYRLGLLSVAILLVIVFIYTQSSQKAPEVIEYTVNNPNPDCSRAELASDGTPPTITDPWQTPCNGGYFYLKPYKAVYYNFNDQSYFITKDASVFRVYKQDLSRTYAQDGKKVYHMNELVEGVDPKTFSPPN